MMSVVLTCAVTGGGDTTGRSRHVPITPEQIARAAIEAAEAGAAVVHLHVRDPTTGAPSRNVALFRETVRLIRASDTDVVLNLTGGHGGDLTIGPPEQPMAFDLATTDLASVGERYAHVAELRPEICTIDCGSMNFGTGNTLMVNTYPHLLEMARYARTLGVRAELECFELGHVGLGKRLIADGATDAQALFQLCTGIPGGAPATPTALTAMVSELPPGANWSAFGISQMQMPMVAQAALLGGNIRVGLEDNLYLERGVLATNAQLVKRAADIVRLLGGRVLTPAECRSRWHLTGAT